MSERPASFAAGFDEVIGELAEEYSQRLRNGEKPDVEEYARRHPDVADAVRQILPALEIMGAVPSDADPNGDASATSAPNKALGDYEIVREVGRGGMGVVYEARQLSLSRRVALKVLPFAAVLDERQIQRFRNEALAAAQLDHPHIVDVYGVGCERSVHFYAMRYVEGESLAQVVAELQRTQSSHTPAADSGAITSPANSDPTRTATGSSPLTPFSSYRSATDRDFFRSVARIGIEIAQALDHAHQQGVVHRDVKPANIIIDASGKSWVTDFGLARMESGATLTMTGDLLGTLRYMSPEQALAKRVVVDHRTDVYSLGVTLYELLTLQPAYPDEDRHELLRQIAFEEPRAPRRVNRAIPEDLETIILKSLAKNPNERYETAQDLADDLGRFLESRPVRARRPTLMQRVASWSRRHKRIVWSAVVVLILLTTLFAVSTALVWSEKRRTDDALTQARKNFRLAEDQRLLAEQHAREARAAALEAEQQRELAQQRAAEVEAQHRRAEIHLSIAQLLIELEPRLNETRTWLDSGVADAEALTELATILVREHPEERGAWKLLAESYDAAGRHAEALERFESLAVEFPRLAEAQNRLAWFLANCPDRSLRDADRAVKVARRTVQLDPENPWFLNTLGVAHYRARQWFEAVDALERSCALGWDDGFNSFFLAMCHWQLGEPETANRLYAAALEHQQSALPIAGTELRRLRKEADALMQNAATPPTRIEPNAILNSPQ